MMDHRFPHCLTGDGFTLPAPANEDMILSDTRTPAEALQAARRISKEMCGELIADPRLWNCLDHRVTRELVRGVEQIARRQLLPAE